jgi:hypothetical protein
MMYGPDIPEENTAKGHKKTNDDSRGSGAHGIIRLLQSETHDEEKRMIEIKDCTADLGMNIAVWACEGKYGLVQRMEDQEREE